MDVLKLVLRCPQFHVRHVAGSGNMFICLFVVDVIVELKVWCDLCEKPVGMGVGCMYFFCIHMLM